MTLPRNLYQTILIKIVRIQSLYHGIMRNKVRIVRLKVTIICIYFFNSVAKTGFHIYYIILAKIEKKQNRYYRIKYY